jgi:hypothetical protein
MSIQLNSTLAQSGLFCTGPQPVVDWKYVPLDTGLEAAFENHYLICNPGVLEKHRGSYDAEQLGVKAEAFWSECKKTPTIKQADLDAYGRTCIELARDLANLGGHLRLGPLRGAARPCLLMEAMAFGSGDFTFFNYKAGCQPQNADRVKSELYPILKACDPNEAVYRIQVVDTAIGGHGINELTKYLRELKEKYAQFRNQKWELDLRILHANDGRTNIDNIEGAKSHSVEGSFEVCLSRYVVPDLIVEDYDAALGLEIKTDHGKVVVKQSYKPGQILLKSEDGSRLVKSEALVVTFDELLAESITDEMIHSQDLQQVGNLWQDYQQKG